MMTMMIIIITVTTMKIMMTVMTMTTTKEQTALSLTAATTLPTHEAVNDKTTQTMYTDNNGHATFTVQLGPKSDTGIYDTEIEITKDSYQSNFQQANLHVI
jgi:hypothetical protein